MAGGEQRSRGTDHRQAARPLREILPKIGARYRQLIITWASDPQTFTAMVGLLKNVLTLVK